MTTQQSTRTVRSIMELARRALSCVRSAAMSVALRTLCMLLLSCVLAPRDAAAQSPIQWSISEGGNGHWYQRVTTESEISWTEADTSSRAAGGHLLTMTSATEDAWVFARFVAGQPTCSPGSWALPRSIWIGLRQDSTDPEFSEPAGGWRWVTGEPLDYTNWAAGEPDNGDGAGAYAGMYVTGTWDDIPADAGIFCFKGYVIEWSADCDGDGDVDLGQILSGELDDANGNGVPDCCEGADTPTDDCNGNDVLDTCELNAPGADSDADRVLDACERAFGDFDLDGEVGAADLSLLLSVWSGMAPPFGDLDGDGEVGAADLSLLLVKWGRTPPWIAPIVQWITPRSGPVAGGTQVLVSGEHLDAVTDVWFGANSAVEIERVSPHLVRVTTPAGTVGAQPVTAISDGGSSTLNGAFTYDASWFTVLEAEPDPQVVLSADARNAIRATGLPWRVRDNGTHIEMLLVPPGTFRMGCSGHDAPSSLPISCSSNELPSHDVTLTRPLYIGRYEVTQSQWTRVRGSNPSVHQGSAYPDPEIRPVENASYNEVQSFLAATGLRLPTEAEWEHACRAGSTTAYHGFPGMEDGFNTQSLLGSIAWYESTVPSPVGQRFANGLGIHDMLGNVREWVSDWYAADYYAASPSVDPQGPATGSSRVVRGRGYQYRSSGRSPSSSIAAPAGGLTGFRVARTPLPAPESAIYSVIPKGGPVDGGATITIRGENLQGATAVLIGGVPASDVAVLAADTVTAVSPPGARGLHDVEVHTPLGVAVQSAGFRMAEVPAWATMIEAEPDPGVVTNASLREAIRATGYAWRVRDNASSSEMLLVPPGDFDMGCSRTPEYACLGSELPNHRVAITKPFYLGRFELTQAQWESVMGENPSYFQGAAYPDAAWRPVEQVSWLDIQVFLGATGLRLPTEAEWELACRAGTSTAYHATPSAPSGAGSSVFLFPIAWYSDNSSGQTSVVGQRAANTLGLHDMAGNVDEWVADWYSWSYYMESPYQDPPGPVAGTSRVRRGGGWNDGASDVRASARWGSAPEIRSNSIGCRVARDTVDESLPRVASIQPRGGPVGGGTEITIAGSSLANVVAVRIGGREATELVSIDNQTLRALTPPGLAGRQDVRLIFAGRTPAPLPDASFVYVEDQYWATTLEAAPDPRAVLDVSMRSAIEESGLPWRVRDNATNIEMLLVPSGTFAMGCSQGDSACSSDESPLHVVTLTNSFYLGRYEVTQAQWSGILGTNPSRFQGASYPDAASRPVERVSWNQIQQFLQVTGLRLPTEAEWECAYRAGSVRAYHAMPGAAGGTNESGSLGTIAWYSANAASQTQTVGGKAANALGFHDLAGNVWEWVQDWFSSTFYTTSPSLNPSGPSTGTKRAIRGGSWTSGTTPCRASERASGLPESVWDDVGLRVAKLALREAQPTIAGVTPSKGPLTGGTQITITGANLNGVHTVRVGGVSATDVVIVDPTQVVAVTPASTPGSKDVSVTNSVGTATLAGAFVYDLPPTIIQLSPSTGPSSGGTAITVTGTKLADAYSVSIGGREAASISAQSDDTVLVVSPVGIAGAADCTVLTPFGTATAVAAFTYENPPRPAIGSINPDMGPSGGGTMITITGENFYNAASPARVLIDGVEATGVSVVDSRTMTAMTPPGAAGAKSVQVATQSGSASLEAAFTYENPPPPTITAVSPYAGASAGGSRLTIEGTNFYDAAIPAGVRIDGVAATDIAVLNASMLTAVTPPGSVGPKSVTVTTQSGTAVLPGGYTYFGPPTMSALSPSGGPLLGGTPITITGNGFYHGASNAGVSIGGVAATEVQVLSPTTMTALTPLNFLGPKTVVVTTASGTAVLPGGYTYFGPPTMSALSPSGGPLEGGTPITITGTNFYNGLNPARVSMGSGEATNVTVVNATTITALTPPGSGLSSVEVITSSGGPEEGKSFWYHGAPSISNIVPSGGSPAGGTPFTIHGTGLYNGTNPATVSIGGIPATNIVVVNSTKLTAVSPPGATGAQDVTVATTSGVATRADGFNFTNDWFTILEQNPDPAVVIDPVLRNAIIATGYPWRVRDNGTNIEMVLIPPGTFNMGCSASSAYSCETDESPVHSVTLTNAFYLGRYEVTQAQWTAKMGSNPSYYQSASAQVPFAQVPNRPVEKVSWNMIQNFLTATGMRLPTEAEWEYAYRAGTTTAFHGFTGYLNGTNDNTLVGNIAWFSSNSNSQTRPVGGKAANGFGLHDMSGNVWEWVNDWYSSSYYASSPSTNPPGPATGTARVLRGGSWSNSEDNLRSSNRDNGTPGNTNSDKFGFRVARAPG